MAQKEIFYKENTFFISYDLFNAKKNQVILFLHGWGANKELMEQSFKNCFVEYRHIYVDLPGFGHSNSDMILKTDDYAKIISLFLKELQIEPFIVLGHSFGGKIASLLNFKILVLLSCSGILEKKSFRIKTKIAVFKILKVFGLGKFRRFIASDDVKNMNNIMYETFKNVVNEDFSPFFATIKRPTFIFWGKEDKATSLNAGRKVCKLIEASKFFPLDGNHFFFLKQAKTIEKELLLGIKQVGKL